LISSLIQTTQNVDIVKDRIAEILVTESSSQQQLASAAHQDSDLWKLRVFTDRSDVIGEFKPDELGCAVPIVVVNFAGWEDDRRQSTDISEFVHKCRYTVDIYGYGAARGANFGHQPADYVAERETHRARALVEQILNAAEYLQLGFSDAAFGDRKITSLAVARPNEQPSNSSVMVSRLIVEITVCESSPQMEPIVIGGVSLTVTDNATGELLASADYLQE
jgi:hypothetical protein